MTVNLSKFGWSNLISKGLSILRRAHGFSNLMVPLIAGLILCLFLFVMLQLAGVNNDLLPLVLSYTGFVVVVLSGNLVLSLAETTFWPGRLLVGIVVGFCTTVLVLLGGVFVVHLTAAATFAGWAFFVILISIARLNLCTSGGLRQNAPDLLALICIVVLSSFVCRHAATVEWLIGSVGNIQLWYDYYIHGATIAQFGDPLAIGRQKLLLSDNQVEFYHYGIFLAPAILLQLFRLSGLVAAGAILLPFGLVIGAAGAYALATTLANRWAGVLVLTMLFLLPDPAAYGLKNGFFSFQWMVMTSPGVGYGLGVAAASLVCVNRWPTSGRWIWAALSIVLALSLSQLRFHIFILFVPTLGLTFALMMIDQRHWKKLFAAAVLITGTALWLLVILEPMLITFSTSVVKTFLFAAHTAMAPTGYDGFYNWAIQNLSTASSICLGVLLIIPAVLGVFVVLYPAAAILSVKRTGLSPIDSIPISLIVFYIALIFLSPSSEFQHRPCVLVYLLIVVFTAVYLVRISPLRESAATAAVNLAVVVVAAASVSSLAVSGFDPGRPRFGWGLAAYNWRVDPSVLKVANFLRREAKPGDTMALTPIVAGAFVDSGTVLASLTNIPIYLACPRCAAYFGNGSIAEDRLRRLREVELARTREEKYAILRRIGVKWYVVRGGSKALSAPSADAVLQVPFGIVYRVPTYRQD